MPSRPVTVRRVLETGPLTLTSWMLFPGTMVNAEAVDQGDGRWVPLMVKTGPPPFTSFDFDLSVGISRHAALSERLGCSAEAAPGASRTIADVRVRSAYR